VEESTTAVNCERDGHCLHEATDPFYWWCCKCGTYIEKYPQSKFYKDPHLFYTQQGLADIDAGRYRRVK